MAVPVLLIKGLLIIGALAFSAGVASSALSQTGLDVFEGMQSFFCWLITSILDLMLVALVTVLERIPGGFLEVQTVADFVALFAKVDDYIPVRQMLADGATFLVFYTAWVCFRALIKLTPMIG